VLSDQVKKSRCKVEKYWYQGDTTTSSELLVAVSPAGCGHTSYLNQKIWECTLRRRNVEKYMRGEEEFRKGMMPQIKIFYLDSESEVCQSVLS
jgi:hypothetical protein